MCCIPLSLSLQFTFFANLDQLQIQFELCRPDVRGIVVQIIGNRSSISKQLALQLFALQSSKLSRNLVSHIGLSVECLQVPYYRPNYNVDRANDNRMDRRMERPSASSSYVPPSSASDRFTAPSSSMNGDRRPANDEKYRNTNTVVNPNWYHNRVKMYDP